MKALWEKLFGTAWAFHKSLFPDIGGFILNRRDGTCLTDENARKLMGAEDGAEYALFCDAVKGLAAGEHKNGNLLTAVMLQDDVYTAGFIARAPKGQPEEKDAGQAAMQRFRQLIEGNLFYYDLQPIVSARDGEVRGWEALMRTDWEIGLKPLQILDLARNTGRLYDIEKITLQNTFRLICENQAEFANKKLFINSIPAYALTDDDWAQLVQTYAPALQNVVIEMTEQTQLDDDHLDAIRQRLHDAGVPLAIDDYGAGYSNTTNLLRYKPDYVKIDRMLVEGINDKPKVQNLVAGLIDFFHQNGYAALAEGVETFEEMQTMIQLGVDLIQGYYTAKPKRAFVQDIGKDIKRQIKDINLQREAGAEKVYYPQDNETVDLIRMAEEYVSSIVIDKEHVSIAGTPGMEPVECPIVVRDGAAAHIWLKDIAIKNEKEGPAIDIGENTQVVIHLEGDNKLALRGIWVPKTSSLQIVGDGNLEIAAEMSDCYAIGTDSQHDHGRIQLDMSGKLSITSKGENAIGIGGGKNSLFNKVIVNAGNIDIHCAGVNCVGIGSHYGGCRLEIRKCEVHFTMSATKMTCIGALEGTDNSILIENYVVTMTGEGLHFCGIGVQNRGTGNIRMHDGYIRGQARARYNTCIGGYGGCVECVLRFSEVDFYCEGGYASGIGDANGSGDVDVAESSVRFEAHCQDGNGFGSAQGELRLRAVKDIIIINP